MTGLDFWDMQASQHAMQPVPASVYIHIWPLDRQAATIRRFLVQWIAASRGKCYECSHFWLLATLLCMCTLWFSSILCLPILSAEWVWSPRLGLVENFTPWFLAVARTPPEEWKGVNIEKVCGGSRHSSSSSSRNPPHVLKSSDGWLWAVKVDFHFHNAVFFSLLLLLKYGGELFDLDSLALLPLNQDSFGLLFWTWSILKLTVYVLNKPDILIG